MDRTLATAAGVGLTRLTRMVSEDLNQQFVLALLELVDNGVVKRVLVLLKPASDVVTDLFHKEIKSDVIDNFNKSNEENILLLELQKLR